MLESDDQTVQWGVADPWSCHSKSLAAKCAESAAQVCIEHGHSTSACVYFVADEVATRNTDITGMEIMVTTKLCYQIHSDHGYTCSRHNRNF